MNAPLRDYQAKALFAVAHEGYQYLGLEQGLGKSRILIEYAKLEGARRILVFCPASVRLSWETEVAKWWSDAPPVVLVNSVKQITNHPGIFVMSYDRISRGEDYVKAIGLVMPFDLAFADEAHYAKNLEAKRTKHLFRAVLPKVGKMILASGTPAPNHAGELYPALRFLAPEKIMKADGRPMTQTQFEDAFCRIEQKFFNGRQTRVITGSQNIPALRERLNGFLLRMRKSEVLTELPPLEFVPTPLAPSLAGIEANALRGYSDILSEDMSDEQVLAALGSMDENAARLRVALGVAKANAAIEYIDEFMDGSQKKIVVWAIHQNVIDILMSGLKHLGAVKIDGRTPEKDRRYAIAAFLGDANTRVFIGNIQAAGTGLTLIGPQFPCSDAFFVESDYVPGNNLQAAARIHRLGQRDGVLARVFFARKTIDDRVQSILARKQNELAQIFN